MHIYIYGTPPCAYIFLFWLEKQCFPSTTDYFGGASPNRKNGKLGPETWGNWKIGKLGPEKLENWKMES